MNTDREHSEQQTKQSRWGFRGMTVREWLELLIVPVVLALITVVFTWQQNERQQDLETKRTNQAQKIENQRAEAERELAEQRAQDEALQAYLDQMTQLILDRKLLKAEPGDPVHTLAQARTSTVILRLDAQHNESVTLFLMNSGLAESIEGSPRLLREINLSDATLSDAYLPNADLSDAGLIGADLRAAYLRDADLGHANLWRVNLGDADLSGAKLDFANLNGADLSGADLFQADLRLARLSEANLRKADLSNAQVTQQQLEAAKSLEGATMPNGQKYEDWIKDKESHGEGE